MNVEWILSSCVLILLVVLVRFLFRQKIPPHVRYGLWLAVALRLLLPFSFSETEISILNLLPEQTGFELKQSNQEITYTEEDFSFSHSVESGQNGHTPEKEQGAGFKEEPASTMMVMRRDREKDISAWLGYCWLFGGVLLGSVILAVNLDYGRRLKQSRKRMTEEILPISVGIPVYTAECIQIPCLFGVFYPAIYVTDDIIQQEKSFAFVLCHENVHYRHHDNWWALVRVLCLCLHWYNPLVWLAVWLSRQDGELACDEGVLQGIGQKACADYGKTLLELSAVKISGVSRWQISTMMRGSKKQLKERLRMIVNMPGKSAGAQFLLLVFMILVLAVTFTGKVAGKKVNELTEEKPAKIEEPVEMEQLAEAKEDVSVPRDNILIMDLNFDGFEDSCVRKQTDGLNTYYDCMLWNPLRGRFEYSVTLCGVETDEKNQWISSQVRNAGGQNVTTCYRYDSDDQLHMVRYVEENTASDAAFEKLDLTYVEDDSVYTLPATVDKSNLHLTMIAMAKQALTELYQWTGEKVESACFQVTDMGGVYFALSPSDLVHSRIFYSRYFGVDTEYNLSGYDKSISSIWVASEREVWYSPVGWQVFPKNMDTMTDQEIMVWYFERLPSVAGSKVKSVLNRYGNGMWTVQTEDETWFEVVYDAGLRQVLEVTGPYPELPEH